MALCLAGVLLVLGLSFPRFVLENILQPVAIVLWLILRLFVLGIHQAVFWWGVILIAAFVAAAIALRAWERGISPAAPLPSVFRDPVWAWRLSIKVHSRSQPEKDAVRRDLAWLLTSPYASSRPGSEPYQVLAALRERRIPVPQSIYQFLFSSTRPRDYLDSVDDVLTHIETLLESKHGSHSDAR